MGITWTKEQQQVINLRDRNILVSAAAGSGKTAVLVERIIKLISDGAHPVDIDHLLVVTFTKAAAAEMRERIREAIERRLDEEPDNVHLQRQTTLVHNAQITTIHSFCLYVIRNYFYAIDLDPGFRVGDDGEMKLLRNEVAERLLEEAYEQKNPAFERFIESFAPGKSDNKIIEYILQVYNFSMSYPWPGKWMEQCRNVYQIQTMEELEQAPWMGFLLKNIDMLLQDIQAQIENALEIIHSQDGPYMYAAALEADKDMTGYIRQAHTYQEYSIRFQKADKFARLSGKRDTNVSEKKKELVKYIRSQVKDSLQEIREQYFYAGAAQILEDMKGSRETVEVLFDLTVGFLEKFTEKKRERGLLDYNDLEHLALDILVEKEDAYGKPTEIAGNLSGCFEEIMIDEYQDSNLVQEFILTSVSRAWKGFYNIFMVGDVKQSIYRFRLARPELFMEKYSGYSLEDACCQRIDLHKNFRSRGQVLDSVNYIFEQIMTDDLGKIEYDKEAALYTGAEFPDGNRMDFTRTEVLLLDLDATAETIMESGENERELEAGMVGKRIQEIVGSELVLDKKTGEYRPAEYRDIVILLRTIAGWADVFSSVLESRGIPSYTGAKTGYFTAVEIQTTLSLLKIIDNPKQEIPMTAVLASPMVGLDTEELALIKNSFAELTYDEACRKYAEAGKDKKLRVKLADFFVMLEDFRNQVPYTTMHELLMYVLEKTGYEDYAAAMPAGEQRRANLNMLIEKSIAYERTSYKGLFNFIRYIENLQKYDVDFGEASTIGEDENTVRIMSIHKSKGLEFPIVFVSGLYKKFNHQDARGKLVLHQDLGLGSDYVDPDLRVRAPTLFKKLLQREVINENLGEELRVLYVALTRAREKLIMTGAVSKLENQVRKWSQACRRQDIKLSFSMLTEAQAHLDWIMPCILRHKSGNLLLELYEITGNLFHPLYDRQTEFVIQVYDAAKLEAQESERQLKGILSREALLKWDTEKVFDGQARELLRQNLNTVYPHEESLDIYGKVTVSEIKRSSQIQDSESEYLIYEEPEVVPYIPGFMKQEEEAGSAARGTIYHKFLEHLDFCMEPSILAVMSQMEQFCREGRLTAEEARWIDTSKVVRFLNSELGCRMRLSAKKQMLYREQPFVIGVEAYKVQPGWESNDMVLVQGIIDAYIQEEDEIVLVDYKTDFVRPGEEKKLFDKYHLQLQYYAEALERMSGKQVKEKIIYSFWLQKELSNK